MQPGLQKQGVKYGLFLLFVLLCLGWLFLGPIPIEGTLFSFPFDFIGYWSASYLLSTSQNFSDPTLLSTTQHTVVGWGGNLVVRTWNPPWLLPLLLPFTFFPFARAVWLWLITNITMIFVAGVTAWLAMAQTENGRKKAWLAPIIAIFFAPTLTALYMGQVNTFVFLGLALTLFCHAKNRNGLAGMALSLTMVKPHLVYITIPILLLDALVKKQWRFIAGFVGMLVFLTGVTFVLRPSFPLEYFSSVAENNLFNWITPTLGDFLTVSFGWKRAEFMGIIILPLMIVWWWFKRAKIDFNELLQITLIISVITAPFGWGYDAIVLLIPVLQIVVWVLDKSYTKTVSILLIASIILIDAFAFYHRTVMENEVEVFWIPLAIGFVYFTARYLKRKAFSR